MCGLINNEKYCEHETGAVKGKVSRAVYFIKDPKNQISTFSSAPMVFTMIGCLFVKKIKTH
jgi:hypothetical protein